MEEKRGKKEPVMVSRSKNITTELIIAQEIRSLFLLYLEKFEKMTDRERDVFYDYLSRQLKGWTGKEWKLNT